MNDLCRVTAELDQHQSKLAKNERRDELLRDEHPLQEFEAQAWERLCDPCENFLPDIVEAMPEVVCLALAYFAEHRLQHGYGYDSDLLRHADAMKVHRRIDEYLTQAEQDLQDACVEDEMDSPSGPEPEDV